MKQPDNHIDELGEILETHRHDYWDYTKALIDLDEFEKREETAIKQLDQYYADFYRNKIPEKKKVKGYNELAGYSRFAKGYNQAIDDITAQFNSKEGKDE